MVILIPPLFGGRRIHDTEASYSHGVEPPWILPKGMPSAFTPLRSVQNDNDVAF